MKVLVVNIGSTSFKFCLFDMRDERVLARGGVEGVGRPDACLHRRIGDGPASETIRPVADQAEAVRVCTEALAAGSVDGRPLSIDAVGFKAVHGGSIGEPVQVTDDVLRIMAQYADICPAHNPAYIAAMRAFAAQMPEVPQVAAFETGFHQTIPDSRNTYAVPYEWKTEYGIRRYGFHGASHRFIAWETAKRFGRDDLRVISCHLGGSSSICALDAGRSVANSFGLSPQSGVPHNNRVGDFDAYALPALAARRGETFDALLAAMATQGGLLGISGVSNDMRVLIEAAQRGHHRAELAVEVFVESVRHYIGGYAVALGGLDVLVFTGGIGERSPEVRRRVCQGLEFLGVRVDPKRNEDPPADGRLSADRSPVSVLAMETNEELVVARQTETVLTGTTGALN